MKEIDFRDISQMEALKDALSGDVSPRHSDVINTLFSLEEFLSTGYISREMVELILERVENGGGEHAQ